MVTASAPRSRHRITCIGVRFDRYVSWIDHAIRRRVLRSGNSMPDYLRLCAQSLGTSSSQSRPSRRYRGQPCSGVLVVRSRQKHPCSRVDRPTKTRAGRSNPAGLSVGFEPLGVPDMVRHAKRWQCLDRSRAGANGRFYFRTTFRYRFIEIGTADGTIVLPGRSSLRSFPGAIIRSPGAPPRWPRFLNCQ